MRVQYIPLAVLLCVASYGCGGPAPSFVLHKKTAELVPVAHDAVQVALVDNFGTPNDLVGWQIFPIDYGEAKPGPEGAHDAAAGWKLVQGRNLYMVHCMHCHGVSGDGNGPTAKFLNPRPRDYRNGIFKFTSTQAGLKPSRSDLKAVLDQGVAGTSMPSFVLLPPDHMEAIIEYVRWLSTRGEFELKLDGDMVAKGAVSTEIDRRVADGRKAKQGGETRAKILEDLATAIKEELGENISNNATDLADAWAKADNVDSMVTPKTHRPPPTPESLERGRKLYLSKTAKCVDCHGLTGRGDGSQTEDFMDVPKSAPLRKFELVGLHDEWGQPIQPRNLTRGVYRGGRRPLDIYRRIYSGIKGTPMPAFSTALKEEEVWDLVNYVLSIPFGGKVSAQPADAEHQAAASKVASSRE